MLKVAVPNKGSLSDKAMSILAEAGYATRGDSKSLTVCDTENNVEFFFLRPKDIAIYVAAGHLDVGITGRDLAADSNAEVREVLALGFGASTFRYAAPKGSGISTATLAGKRIATSYPNLVKKDLAARGVDAEVIRLDGAVEISIKLGVADVIADVVSTGTTLRRQGLEPFGEPLITSEAVVVVAPNRPADRELGVLLARIEGIMHARDYIMLDYNVPTALLDQARAITPGISGPTVSPLATDEWVAVRAMVPRQRVNSAMDEIFAIGGKAILATEIRIARL